MKRILIPEPLKVAAGEKTVELDMLWFIQPYINLGETFTKTGAGGWRSANRIESAVLDGKTRGYVDLHDDDHKALAKEVEFPSLEMPAVFLELGRHLARFSEPIRNAETVSEQLDEAAQ